MGRFFGGEVDGGNWKQRPASGKQREKGAGQGGSRLRGNSQSLNSVAPKKKRQESNHYENERVESKQTHKRRIAGKKEPEEGPLRIEGRGGQISNRGLSWVGGSRHRERYE